MAQANKQIIESAPGCKCKQHHNVIFCGLAMGIVMFLMYIYFRLFSAEDPPFLYPRQIFTEDFAHKSRLHILDFLFSYAMLCFPRDWIILNPGQKTLDHWIFGSGKILEQCHANKFFFLTCERRESTGSGTQNLCQNANTYFFSFTSFF